MLLLLLLLDDDLACEVFAIWEELPGAFDPPVDFKKLLFCGTDTLVKSLLFYDTRLYVAGAGLAV